MQQAMNALISVLVIILFFITDARPSVVCGNVSTVDSTRHSALLQEAILSDSTNIITAEYCLSFYENEIWKLLLYKQIEPFTIKIKAKSYDNAISGSANLNADVKLNYNFTGISSLCMAEKLGKWHKCRVNIDDEFIIHSLFNTLYSIEKIDTTQISVLLVKFFQ